jgi:hypothetical protein
MTRSITDAGGSCPVAGQIAALAANLLARAGLSICKGITPRRATKPVRRGSVSVGSAATMLRIVRPVVSATPACRLIRRPVSDAATVPGATSR